MGSRKFDGLLREWAGTILREIENSGYSKTTITAKLMECGVMVDSGVIPVPGYWPKRHIQDMHNNIMALPVKYRNVLVARYVLGHNSPDKIAEICGCHRNSVNRRLEEAIRRISG